jgi:predicted transposase YbfD/YdcC
MTNYSTLNFTVPVLDEPIAFDADSLYAYLHTLEDKRDDKGKIYPLAPLLFVAILAKLMGQNQLEHITRFATQRAAQLCRLLKLKHCRMPHKTTWGRILSHALDIGELETLVANFFTHFVPAEIPARGQAVLCIDGKTLRGTIPVGQTQGVHLLAAFLPTVGIVLAQIAVDAKENEIVAAPKLLETLDLRGLVVTGDALHTQRALSVQIVAAGGDWVWTVKDNQKTLHDDLVTLFNPAPVADGQAEYPTDFRTASKWDKTRGKLEHYEITVSSWLADYSDWPHLSQAFKMVRRVYALPPQALPGDVQNQVPSRPAPAPGLATVAKDSNAKVGRTKSTKGKSKSPAHSKGKEGKLAGKELESEEIRYGITSLPSSVTKPAQLMALVRAEWGIENKLHWRRDYLLAEDWSRLRRGSAPQANAVLNNLMLGLIAIGGPCENVAEARSRMSYDPNLAINLLTKTLLSSS